MSGRLFLMGSAMADDGIRGEEGLGDRRDDEERVEIDSSALAREMQMRRSDCGQGERGTKVGKFVRGRERLRQGAGPFGRWGFFQEANVEGTAEIFNGQSRRTLQWISHGSVK